MLVALLALPWLWPFTLPPRPDAEPYLAAAISAALLLALWPAPCKRDEARWLTTGWLLAATVNAVISLLQYFHLEAPLRPWVTAAPVGLAIGNLGQPNLLATLLVIGLCALRWRVQTRRLSILLAVAPATLLLVALVASASRIGLVELLALSFAVLWWSQARGKWRLVVVVILSVLVLYALTVLILPSLVWAFDEVYARDVFARLLRIPHDDRLVIWRNMLELIALKPWLGWGWGELGYAHYMTLYDSWRYSSPHILTHAHNLPLQLAVEFGVPAALAACGLVAWLVWRGQPWREVDPTRQLAWGVLLAVGLHSMVEYPLWYGPFQIAVVICVWMLGRSRRVAGLPRASRSRTCVRVAVAALVLLAAGYAQWDYWRASQPYLPASQRAAAWRADPIAAASHSRLFADAAWFAEVTSCPVTHANAAWTYAASQRLLHSWPEPRVIVPLIESARLLGRDDVVDLQKKHFRVAFPLAYRRWASDSKPDTQIAPAPVPGAMARVGAATQGDLNLLRSRKFNAICQQPGSKPVKPPIAPVGARRW